MIAHERALVLVVALLLLTGAGVRLVNLSQPLLSFHPTRQFRSALIARACYYERDPAVAEWAREIARANVAMQPAGEPAIMEGFACAAYAVNARENLAIPRTVASLVWVVGALPLYGIARRLTSPLGAIVGLATYLFMPYGIVASRAFQPDPLMTTCSLWAVWAIVRHAEARTARRLGMAALAIAAASLVKPMSVFMTVPAVAGVAVGFGGMAAVLRVSTWVPVAIGLAPAAVYYGYSTVFGTLARDQMNLRFVPALIPTTFFWGGFWRMIQRVMGASFFVAALLGTAVATGAARSLLVALWFGYLLFAMAFTYHMPTHDYYHLPYIALSALAIAALFAALEQSLMRRSRRLWPRALALAAAVAMAAWGTFTALPRLYEGDRSRIAMYEEIGELAQHHSRVLFLDTEYGYPLMYHGQVSGDSWPSSDDLAAEALGGATRLEARERFARDYADYGPSYFIVTDLRSLGEQPDLQQFLSAHATAIRQGPAFHVYKFK